MLAVLLFGSNSVSGQIQGARTKPDAKPTVDTLSLETPPPVLPGGMRKPDSTGDTTNIDSLGTAPFPAEAFPGAGDSTALSPQAKRQQQIRDSLKANSDLTAPVVYNAEDSIVFDVETGTLYLYEQAKLTYDEIELESKAVKVDIEQQTLYADGVPDENGKMVGTPVFTQDGQSYNARSMTYNFKTSKGRIKEGRMVQGEGFIIAETAKYHQDGSFHGADGIYTTCDAEHPHYYIRSRKIKVLPDNNLISGPLNLVIADFPLPLVIPFAFVPNQKGKSNGIILPKYGEAQDRGFFLRDFGYYREINDYLSAQVNGEIFTRGGWGAGITLRYKKRYPFSGAFSFDYKVNRKNERTDPDFSRQTGWNLRWNHNQKIDPTARISGSVNISNSSTFQRELSLNQNDFIQNDLNSSVNFQKNFNNLPFSFNISARHQQDLNEGTMSLQLPELSFNMNRQTPFRNVGNKNLKWLKQLGINYNMQARNSVRNIPDSLLLPILFNPRDSVDVLEIVGGDSSLVKRRASSFYTNGLRHQASTGTTIKLFKYINISPSFNFSEFWYLQTIRKTFDTESNRVVESTVPGFERGFNFNTSVSASTNFYGIYQLHKTARKVTFRQRFTPSVGYSLKPDFSDERWGFYRDVQRDTLGNVERYSIFEDGIYNGPTRGESQSLSFSLSSVLEMKYLKKEGDEEEDEKKGRGGSSSSKDDYIRTNVIDNLGISSSYNFAADSFQLAPFSLRARTSLLNRKVNITTSATLDPYVFGLNEVPFPYSGGSARKQNKLLINETGQLGRLTRVQVSVSTSFKSKKGGRNTASKEMVEKDEFDEDEYNFVLANPEQYVDFTLPWQARMGYNFSYSKPGVSQARVTQTFNVSGSLTFGSSWNMSFNTGYDIANQKVSNTSMNVTRSLHCWQMSFRWTPFPRKSYSVVISSRSSTLSMLKLSKNDFWQDRFQAF
ncbi:MAG: putative LPS assembly protein LptD [Bacteroidota bacterium]